MPTNAQLSRRFVFPRTCRTASGLVGLWAAAVLSGCPRGDVGAPCNHGQIEPPSSKLVTFPALSCDELLCVYADETEPPASGCTVGPEGDAACNEVDPSVTRFECVASSEDDPTAGQCRLRNQYVLERSMCSKKCGSDSDCQNGGITQQVVVDDTECRSGFTCARIQTLGEFCCEKLCVCRDDLSTNEASRIDVECTNGTQAGCCVPPPGQEEGFVVPDACG